MRWPFHKPDETQLDLELRFQGPRIYQHRHIDSDLIHPRQIFSENLEPLPGSAGDRQRKHSPSGSQNKHLA